MKQTDFAPHDQAALAIPMLNKSEVISGFALIMSGVVTRI